MADIVGANGADNLIGTAGSDYISSGNGNDIVSGGAGADVIDGGNGDDLLDGGSGSDRVSGGNGDDVLIYRAAENLGSADYYDGGNGRDTLRLVVSQGLADSVAFQSEIAQFYAQASSRNSSFTFHSIGLTITGVERVEAVVTAGVNHAPTAVADTLVATEDVPVTILASTLLANDTDADVGDVRTLLSAQSPQHGTVALNAAGNVVFTPDTNYSGPAGFTYTIRDSSGSTSTALVTVDIAAVADAPTLLLTNAAGSEDTGISLNVSAAVADMDGSEHLQSLFVNDIPLGAILTDGAGHSFVGTAGHNSVDVMGWALAGLTINPAPDSDADFSLTLTATSQEGSSGPTASTTASLAVTVSPVADAPLVTTTAAFGAADQSIPLEIHIGLTDLDETLGQTVEIRGVPSSFALNHGVQTDNGGWLVPLSDVPDLALVPSNGLASQGVFTLEVIATSMDGPLAASSSATINVTVTPGAAQTTGRVVDGYIAGATVFADANGDGSLSSGEAFTTTAADGTFTLTDGSGSLVMFGGRDVSTGLTFTGVMTAPQGSSVITPLTTLIAAMAGPDADSDALAAAESAVLLAFSITLPLGVTLKSFDPVPGAVSGDSQALAVLSASIQVQSTVSQVSAGGGTSDVFAAIGASITSASGNAVDLSNPLTITSIANDAGVPQNALSAVTDVVSAANASLQLATDVTTLAQAATVAQGSATEALADTDFSSPSEVNALTQSYVSGLSALVSAAETGDVDGPLLGTIGNDNLVGSANVDAIDGLDGDDTIAGGAGADLLFGGAGKDLLIGGAGDDLLDGGTGADRVSYANALEGVSVNLSTGVAMGGASTGADKLISIEGVRGSAFNDVLTGSFNAANIESLEGVGGDDFLDGNGGFDRAIYNGADTGALGVIVHLGEGTVTGRDANATAVVGFDTLRSIESIRGSNSADIFNAATFTATSLNGGGAGDQGSFNEFEGMGGDDQIVGNGATRISYTQATASVNVAFTSVGAGSATGDASTGVDTFTGVASARGSIFNDVFHGSDNTGSALESFEGWGGDDLIDGGAGLDKARYDTNNLGQTSATLTNGVTINMAAGTVTGRDVATTAVYGSDTLRSIELVRGTDATDVYDATGFSGTSLNAGSNGTFNEFEGMGGNDTITGNGNTRVSYSSATAGVTVDIAAHTASGNASVGTDTLNIIASVRGSNFGDIISGGQFNNTLEGQGGNDVLNGRAGNDTLTGGADADTFLFADGDGLDVVTDFSQAQGDRIDLTHVSGFYSIIDVQAASVQAGPNVVITFSSGHALTLNNVTRTSLTEGDFIFSAPAAIVGDTGANSLFGTSVNDLIQGLGGNDTLQGRAGDDLLEGGGGRDWAVYTDATGGMTVNLASGAASGDGVGSDTLRSIELVRGGAFADVFVATGFNGSSANAGSFGTANTIEGMGGDDIITGNGNTLVSYQSSASGVNVSLATGVAVGVDVGNDVFTGVSGVRGSAFADTLVGSNTTSVVEQFNGGGGDDIINGAGGTDRVIYSSAVDETVTAGITIDMAAGIVTGNASVGVDTLRSVEFARGSNYMDVYSAAGFTASTTNGGSAGVNAAGAAFNEFEGMGGNDTITGNGNTRIAFYNANGGVLVDLAAGTSYSIAAGDAAGIGIDTFQFVNNIAGSQFDDSFFGSNNPANSSEIFDGRAGNDTFDGRGGFDQAVYNTDSAVTTGINVNMAAGSVSGGAAIGVDTLIAIESVRGTNFADSYVATGFAGASTDTFAATFNEFEGMGGNDTITGNGNTRVSYTSATAGVTVDIAGHFAFGDASVGSDTLNTIANVRGSNFGDTISGGQFNNILDGQGGNDVLSGREGNDTLIGGAGADTFVFGTGFNSDVITDFAAGSGLGHDLIDLRLSSFVDYAAVSGAMSQVGNNVVITSGADTLTLNNVLIANLVSADFVF